MRSHTRALWPLAPSSVARPPASLLTDAKPHLRIAPDRLIPCRAVQLAEPEAARRGGRLSVAAHKRALDDFESLRGELSLIGIDAQLAREASLPRSSPYAATTQCISLARCQLVMR
jgi:hypothetical protein